MINPDVENAPGTEEISEIKLLADESRQKAQQAWLVYIGWAAAALVLLLVVSIAVWKQFKTLATQLQTASTRIDQLTLQLAEAKHHSDQINQDLAKEQVRLDEIEQHSISLLAARMDRDDRRTASQFQTVNQELGQRAKTDDFNSLKAQVTGNDGVLRTAVKDLTTVKTDLQQRPQKTDIDDLKTLLGRKAASDDIAKLQTALNDRITQASLDSAKNSLQGQITKLKTDLQTAIEKKLDSQKFEEFKNGLQKPQTPQTEQPENKPQQAPADKPENKQ